MKGIPLAEKNGLDLFYAVLGKIDRSMAVGAGMGLLFTLRKHWKKSAFAGALLCYGINYSSEKFRYE